MPMKIRLAMLLAAIALLMCSCGYWVVEEKPVQVGSAMVQPESPVEN